MAPTPKDLDDLPIFRPRLSGGPKRAVGEGGTTFRRALLRGLRGPVTGHGGPGRAAAPLGDANARRVVVKAHFVRMNASGAKAAALHLRYVAREGVEKDGSKGILYTAEGPARAAAFDEPRAGEKHQFRLIVSPEDAGELDLTPYVRRLMARVERDLGRPLEWAAVNHHDTDHPHAHVVLRGVDRDGRELRLDRAYIAKGLRWRAQELATEELGPRHALDVRRAHVREITQERFTSLDRELERRGRDHGVVEVRAETRRGFIEPSVLVARLRHLEGLRLATRVSRTAWSLVDGWQQTLRDFGERADILKQIHRAVSGDPARYHIVRAGQALSSEPSRRNVLAGRVAGKGLSDELKNTFYAVIETPTGRALHVPLDARSAEALRPGDLVSLASPREAPIRSIDRHIAHVAERHHGVYDVAHDTRPSAARAQRRMRDLDRLGLAIAAGPSRWKVSPNLLDELERRHRDVPGRHRLLLKKQPLAVEAQIRYPGPVWLDGLAPASLGPYGLGAELRRALGARADALRELGVAAEDPGRLQKLRDLERSAVAKRVAETSGKSFLPNTPAVFRGRLEMCTSLSGESFIVVSDEARFAVIKTRPALRRLHGKAVTVTRDVLGGAVVRPRSDRTLE